MAYNPHEHAAKLGIDVVYRRIRTAHGLWIPDIRTIILQPRMRVLHERSVLAHELGHALLGHRYSSAKNELLADRWAAQRLINPDELLAAAASSPDPGIWCHELNVSADILERYLSDSKAA